MRGSIYDLVTEKMGNAQPTLRSEDRILAVLVQLDDADLLQFLHHRLDHRGADVVSGEDLALETGKAVLEPPEIVAVREEAEEEKAGIDRTLDQLLVVEKLGFECTYSCHRVIP
jgi:hypothetical protein